MSQCVLNARIDVSVLWYEYEAQKYLHVVSALCVAACLCGVQFCVLSVCIHVCAFEDVSACVCLCTVCLCVHVCIQRKDINGFSGPQI